MNYFLFRILNSTDLEKVEKQLEKQGLRDLFVIEDDETGEIFIGGQSEKEIESKNVVLVEKKLAEVNWNEQWSLFAENFKDGKAHIQVGKKTLLLNPGPGFGDLSHPTTYLVLEMMKNHVNGESVIDIGSGSGILALAALLLGAKSALGIDIDEAAIKHAKLNAKLNKLKATFRKTLPKNLSGENVFVMNMIFPEQMQLAPRKLNRLAKFWITSGILKEQKNDYLLQAKKWGWQLIEEREHSNWLGFLFGIN